LRSNLINEKQVKDTFASIGQGQIFRFWDELNQAERTLFLQQLEKINPTECQRAWKDINVLQKNSIEPQPPEAIKATKPSNPELIRMHEHGEEMLANGKVAAFTVAGGQGTRLGHSGPKGTFPCTPITKNSLFQHFAESLIFFNKRLGVSLRWFIMTSLENHLQTIVYFEKNQFFGLDKNRVTFFQQGMMPAFDIDGKMLLKEKHKLEMSPNGHGGSLKALVDSGSIDLMEEEEIDNISYFQIDNPMVYCIDPTFLGFHQVTGSEMSSKAVEKLSSNERVGTFVQNEKNLQILEYSDIPQEISSLKKKNGSLIFGLGSIAIHILDRNFVRRITNSEATQRLKYHGAHKKVSYLDDNGIMVKPETPNAIKAETFVFDALPLARNPLLMEINREDEFGPIKNPSGTDSLDTSEKLQISRNLRWLHEVGAEHALTNLEISPLFAPTLPYLSERISELPLDLKKYIFEPVLLGEDGRALEII
jgi:UDP-N-acetylglucosamine/UDP-N-acetylgalactosamine diphosphorylase